jgi:tetratricopeptide (TPR) repeat protein
LEETAIRLVTISCVLLLAIASCRAVEGQTVAVPSAQVQASPVTHESIESLIRSHQYDQALTQTKAELHAHPADFKLWTVEGILFSIQGKPDDALVAFDKALHLAPTYPAALRGKVQILYQSQDQRAIPLLQQILRVDPQDEIAREMLGTLEQKAGDCNAAIDAFQPIAEAIKMHADALEAYGDCLMKTDRPKEAVGVFEQLTVLLPQSADARYDLAVVLVESKRGEEALKIIEPLLAANPSDPELLSLASEAYEAKGDTPRAVASLREAIVLNPSNPNYYAAFAALCLAHSSYQVGIDMLDVGFQHIHDDPSLYISRGLLYAQLAQYDKAEADFNAAERLDSAQSLSSYAIDLAEIEKNQGDKALANIRAQLKIHPESPWLHYALARLLDNKESTANPKASEEAIQSAAEAVRLKPDFVEARNLLANMYLHADNYDGVVEQSRLVLKYDPLNESAMYHLILALRRSGKAGQNDEIQDLSKRLTALQQASFHKEIESNRYKLVEQQQAPK